ncbi:MAG: CotH kinase family protein [Candidatus Marinimicrobia bacterium]|nr:CotH kinase family protein [Candidatus Neomarinimicrobiota bacterium]
MIDILKIMVKGSGILSVLCPVIVLGQALVINEVVSSNHSSAFDEDGDTPDWIELYNPGSSAVDLNGYGISDDSSDPFQFTFRDGSLPPAGHLLIFASEKDRQGAAINWNPAITAGDDWKYFPGSSEPQSSWNSLSFADGSWQTGPTGIGYGDNDDATVIGPTLSLYMRKTFLVADPGSVQSLMFHMDVDDGYIAYLNGVEFARQNMGAPGTFKSYQAVSDSYTEPLLPQNIDLSPILINDPDLVPGYNVLAIQVHNQSSSSSDLTALPFLSLGQFESTGESLPEYLIIPGDQQIHTNFKLSSSGEHIYLSNPEGVLVDSLVCPALTADLSYGCEPDGSEAYHFFLNPTPGSQNSGGFAQLAIAAVPSLEPGFYSGSRAVDFVVPPDGSLYYYTLDGSRPDNTSSLYSGPIVLNQTSILRVRVNSPDGLHHHYSTFSYFIDEPHEMSVMSLTFDPGAFFDNDTGIYVMGAGADQNFPYFGSNFWEDWEQPLHIEYFEDAQDLSFSAPGGVKIFGGWSRGNAQRSLSLFARGSYGVSEFEYPFFAERDYDKFQSLVLRNAGNDWQESGYRDVFMNSLIADRAIDRQAYHPVEVYFNGDYWGVYNLREKISEHMLASLWDIDSDELDLLEFGGSVVHGSNGQYQDLLSFVNSHTLNSDTDFEYVRDRVDLTNFIEYQIAQIYFDNQDWPGNNIKFWKSREPSGRWRWIIYDTDFGFGIWGPNNYQNNTLAFATNPNGPDWPNPPWSTLLLRKFLNNVSFKHEFILKASDMLNTNFLPARVTEKLSSARSAIYSGMSDHFARWNHNNFSHWYDEFAVMQNFGEQRPSYMRSHMRSKFGLPQEQPLTIQVQPENAGVIRVHSVIPRELPWTGYYFPLVPLDVEAISASGYEFSHWENLPSDDVLLVLNMSSPLNLTAVFTALPGGNAGIVINEINYNSDSASDSKDWLELYNATTVPINLTGWYLSDSNDDNRFQLGNVSLEPDGFLVVSSDSLAFRLVHGSTPRIVGDLGFNFSNAGELVRIFDPLGNLVDSLSYDDEAPWPALADGSGATLELVHPSLDNGLSESWAASEGVGTPGGQNSRYLDPASAIEAENPTVLKIQRAYPNPFNAQISISLGLHLNVESRIQIFDLRGALVRDSFIPAVAAGQYTFVWDGKTNMGRDCASGMYIVRVSQSALSNSMKIALLR